MLATKLRGLAEIAKALCVADEHTVLRFAARAFDPLPLRYLFGRPQIDLPRLELWRRREAKDPTLPLLAGRVTICRVLGLGRLAVTRLIRREWHPLPVIVAPDGSWSAYESALQDWISAEVEPGWRRTRKAAAEPREQKKAAPAPRARLKRAA
jgi:hypothetical protein